MSRVALTRITVIAWWFTRMGKKMPQRFFGGAGVAASAAFLAISLGQACAMDTCSGQYSAALLHPLPAPMVVGLQLSNPSDRNVSLAKAFTNGMREAGLVVTGTPTVQLSLTAQVLGQGGGSTSGGGLNPGGGTQSGASSWSGGGASSLQGGQNPALPDFPDSSIFAPQQPVQSALLVLRVEARNTQDNTLSWIAVVQCTMQGTDDQTRAYELGHLVGGSIGKRLDATPL
jgi:hypothetical protein